MLEPSTLTRTMFLCTCYSRNSEIKQPHWWQQYIVVLRLAVTELFFFSQQPLVLFCFHSVIKSYLSQHRSISCFCPSNSLSCPSEEGVTELPAEVNPSQQCRKHNYPSKVVSLLQKSTQRLLLILWISWWISTFISTEVELWFYKFHPSTRTGS